jgi:hypothetical protein
VVEHLDTEEEESNEVIQPKSFEIEDVCNVDDLSKSKPKTLKESDDFILNKLHMSLSELCPPPSITSLPLSLSEMITLYKKCEYESCDKSEQLIKSNSLFVPSHSYNEMIKKEWPEVMGSKAHGIMYNRSTDCEEIELMLLRYTDRFIRAETTTSFNHKSGPSSVKKKIEKLKYVVNHLFKFIFINLLNIFCCKQAPRAIARQ